MNPSPFFSALTYFCKKVLSRKIVFVALSVTSFSTAFSQHTLSFELHATSDMEYLVDTISNPDNIWQVGKPQKNIFNSAYEGARVIVTDTVSVYPANDTSVFYVKCKKRNLPIRPWEIHLFFWYKIDVNAGAYGKVEVSGDSGKTWIDILKEDTTYGFDIYWHKLSSGKLQGKPRLDTSFHDDWYLCVVDMGAWLDDTAITHKTYPSYFTADTFMARFTFVSGNAVIAKDGWMIDFIGYNDYSVDVQHISNDNMLSIYPNPAKDHIYIKTNNGYAAKAELTISNLQGQEVYKTHDIPGNGYLLLNLPGGVYLLRYSTGKEHAVKQLVIRK